MNNNIIKTGLLSLLLLPLLAALPAQAHDRQSAPAEPITLLVNYHIGGNFTGMTSGGLPIYTIGGPGYAPKEIYDTGIVSDAIDADHPVAMLEGAQITFAGAPTDAIVNFTCLPGSCKMTFKDGSVLVSNAGVDLQGRAINMWGPVVRSPNFDPINQIYPIRILGCGGLKEVAGKGRLAGMVGSICFNGVLNFNNIDPSSLTGASKCTITLHTPANPAYIP